MKCPYKYPLRSRKAIIEYLTEFGGHSDRHASYRIAFNVKSYPDLDFDALWEVAEEWIKEGLGDEATQTELDAYRVMAYLLYDQHQGDLWEWGVEDARRGITDADTYRTLWDGTEIDVKWEFHGRQGGWLVPVKLEGWDMDIAADDFEEQLGETPWKDLLAMYKFVAQCEQDFTTEKVGKEIQYQAAFQFFVNIVNNAWDEYEAPKPSRWETTLKLKES